MQGQDMTVSQAKVNEIARTFSLRLVLLFGSRAEGGAGVDSDTDIAVLVNPSVEIDADYDLRLQSAFFKVLGTDRLDVVYLNQATPLLRYRAVADPVILYDEDKLYPDYASYAIRYYADTKKFRDLEQRFIKDFASHDD